MEKMKLRYWDKYTKKMYDDSHFVYWNGNFYFKEDSAKIASILLGRRKNPVGYSILEDNIMQSTGLFDKNGVEIFEGDIIRFDVPNKLMCGIYAVRRANSGVWRMDNQTQGRELYYSVSGVEVIGHKYMSELKGVFE